MINHTRVLFLPNFCEMASETFGREFGDVPLVGLNDRPLTAVDMEIDSPSGSPPVDTRTQATRRVAGRSFPLDHVSRAAAADAFRTNLEEQQGDQPLQETAGALPATDAAPPDPPSLPPSSPIPRRSNANLNLQQIRAQFTPEGMLKNSRSPSTFSKHQRENESLAVYFWLDNDKQQYLTTELQHDLADADMEIDYSHLEARHRRYIRQGGRRV